MEKNNIVTEENITVNDFERVCRTCLSTVDLKPISYVFDFAYFPVEIALNKYTQVQFDPLDNLPKQICSNCVKSLNSSYDFLLNCDSVNTTLKECLTRHERNLLTRICVPNAMPMEYVNCEIKQEMDPGEFDSFEAESNQQPGVPHHPQIETLHMSLDIKEEAPDNSVDENDSDNDDPDGDQMTTNLVSSGKETAKRRSKRDSQLDTNSDENESGSDAPRRRLHTFVKPEGPGRKKRRMCRGCYKTLRKSMTSREADKKTKRITSFCKECPDSAGFCLPCFNEHHK